MHDDWVVYMIELSDRSYYTGITNNLERRLKAHRKGKGSKYVKSRLPILELLYLEPVANKSKALKRESVIKKMTRRKKDALIKSFSDGSLQMP